MQPALGQLCDDRDKHTVLQLLLWLILDSWIAIVYIRNPWKTSDGQVSIYQEVIIQDSVQCNQLSQWIGGVGPGGTDSQLAHHPIIYARICGLMDTSFQ